MEGAYTIENVNNRVIVRGSLPIDDLVALQKAWAKRDLDCLATGVAASLGATMAICRKDDEETWKREVAESATRRAGGDAEMEWLLGHDVGTSSISIFAVLASTQQLRGAASARLGMWGPNVPHDPSDFGRCHRLLEKFPAWRERLPEVAAKIPKYGPMVREWAAMEELWREEAPTGKCPKLYDLMQKLEDEGCKSSEKKRKDS